MRSPGIAAAILALLAGLGLVAIWSVGAGRADPPTRAVPEYALKATFLTRLAAFVTWPTSLSQASATSLGICVLGSDPFGDYLDAAAAASPSRRPIRVSRIDEASEALECHLLFVTKRRARAFESIRDVLCDRHVLTVSDDEDFLEKGGMIGFIRVSDHVELHINRAEIDRVGLRVSSELLQIATVRSTPQSCPATPASE